MAYNCQHAITFTFNSSLCQQKDMEKNSIKYWIKVPRIAEIQARRHGVAFRGRAPPKWLLVPPNENCAPQARTVSAPKKLTGSGLLECKSRPKLVFASGIFVNWHWISWQFGDEDLFFFGDHTFSAGKIVWISDFGRKSLWISVKIFSFFFGDHLFSAGKTVWMFEFGRKIPLNFNEDLFLRSPVFGWKNRLNFWFWPENPYEFLVFSLLFDPDWDKFLMPRAPLEFR